MKNIAGKLAVTAVTTGVVLGASVGMNTTTVLAAEADGNPDMDGASRYRRQRHSQHQRRKKMR